MLTGHPAFTGAGAALAAALTTASPAPSGSPAVDRLVASCIAKDPAARWQRMQKLLLELKLLAVAVQRAETPRREPVDPMPAIRAELQQMESRLAARLESSEAAIETVNGRISGIEQAVKDSVAGMGRLEQAIEERISQFERAATESISRTDKAAGERMPAWKSRSPRPAGNAWNAWSAPWKASTATPPLCASRSPKTSACSTRL